MFTPRRRIAIAIANALAIGAAALAACSSLPSAPAKPPALGA